MRKSTNKKNRSENKIMKNSLRNRLSIFKSNNHIYAQIINDKQSITLASASSLEKNFREIKDISKKEMAKKIGIEIAKRSIKKGIKTVVFDRGKYKYHGLVKIFAESARNEGLEF